MNKSITFETKCYEKDWEFLLKTPLLKKMIENCNYKFDKKILYINNVKNRTLLSKYARIAVKKGIIDKYYFVGDYAKKALKFFNITEESFKGGYPYSISELVSIYLTKTDYLLHFSSDTLVKKSSSDWISNSMEHMENNPQIIVANPKWTKNMIMLRLETTGEDADFYYGKGFSDQCYLVKVRNIRKRIYNEKNSVSNKLYPLHGGELFEKRVNAYMRNHNLMRITSKRARYVHKNFPRNRLLRNLEMFFISRFGADRVFQDYRGDLEKIFKNRINKLKNNQHGNK